MCLSVRKQRKSQGGSALPNASNQAIINGPAPSPHPGSRRQSQQGGHPFANVTSADRETYDASNIAVPSQAGMQPIAPMTVNGRPGNTAANSQQMGEGDYAAEGKGGNGFLKMISCGMCR